MRVEIVASELSVEIRTSDLLSHIKLYCGTSNFIPLFYIVEADQEKSYYVTQ